MAKSFTVKNPEGILDGGSAIPLTSYHRNELLAKYFGNRIKGEHHSYDHA
jgi:hypothetical protein